MVKLVGQFIEWEISCSFHELNQKKYFLFYNMATGYLRFMVKCLNTKNYLTKIVLNLLFHTKKKTNLKSLSFEEASKVT